MNADLCTCTPLFLLCLSISTGVFLCVDRRVTAVTVNGCSDMKQSIGCTLGIAGDNTGHRCYTMFEENERVEDAWKDCLSAPRSWGLFLSAFFALVVMR